MKKGIVIPILILFIIFGALSFYFGSKYAKPETVIQTESQICTKELKKCPDGSLVSRSGPNCAFSQCPTVDEVTEVTPFERAIRYAIDGNKILINFDGKIYEEGEDAGFPKEIQPLTQDIVWKDLVEINVEDNTFKELFSFKTLPNKEDFLIVARYDFDNLHIYKFTAKDQKFEESLFVTKEMTKTGQMFPKIVDTDTTGKYVSLNMYSCWNCGGHPSSRLLWNSETGNTKDLGFVSYFKWLDDGNYEYKEFVEVKCDFEGPGICNEDPKNLPMKTGSFE